jgi:signal transduction histidine kinase
VTALALGHSHNAPHLLPEPAPSLAEELILTLATAADVHDAMTRIVPSLRAGARLQRVEWWTAAEDERSLRLEAAAGFGSGRRTALPLGPLGSLILVGDNAVPELTEIVTRFVPFLRRRVTEEHLAAHAARLARENESLDDFAALVAHELKSALAAVLLRSDVTAAVKDALDLVDSILEVARSQSAPDESAPASRCLAEALRDLGEIDAEVTADLPPSLPVPPTALRILLRNLVANAVAANARHVRVFARADARHCQLFVDDDGVGIGAAAGYAAGSRIGFGLCCRLAARLDGVLELEPRAAGGTRATFVLTGRQT